MTHIFLLHATEDVICSSRIRQDLETRGYGVDDEVQTLDVGAMLYPHTAKSALVASAAVILLWSSNAARNQRIWNAVKFAQQLKRPVLPVTLDSTPFPETLQGATPTLAQSPCDNIVTALTPSLPPAGSNNELLHLYEQAVDISAPVRSEAVERAATMLQSGQYRSGQSHDALLALLECLAQSDPITSVQENAQAALKALNISNTNNASTTVVTQPQLFDKGSSYDYVCTDQHTTSFSKRELCNPNTHTTIRGNTKVALTCRTCQKQATFDIYC